MCMHHFSMFISHTYNCYSLFTAQNHEARTYIRMNYYSDSMDYGLNLMYYRGPIYYYDLTRRSIDSLRQATVTNPVLLNGPPQKVSTLNIASRISFIRITCIMCILLFVVSVFLNTVK